MNVLCFGDSITHAKNFAEGDRWPCVLQHKLNAWQPDTFSVYNRGIGGNTTAQGFDRFGDDVVPLLPGIVLIEFGFNDANVREWATVSRVGLEEFKRNLREFHRMIRSKGGEAIFIVNHTICRDNGPQANGKTYAENFLPYNAAIRNVADELDASAIDLPQRMADENADLEAFLGEDGLHLSPQGNHLYADMVFSALKSMIPGIPLDGGK